MAYASQNEETTEQESVPSLRWPADLREVNDESESAETGQPTARRCPWLDTAGAALRLIAIWFTLPALVMPHLVTRAASFLQPATIPFNPPSAAPETLLAMAPVMPFVNWLTNVVLLTIPGMFAWLILGIIEQSEKAAPAEADKHSGDT